MNTALLILIGLIVICGGVYFYVRRTTEKVNQDIDFLSLPISTQVWPHKFADSEKALKESLDKPKKAEKKPVRKITKKRKK